MWEREVLFLVFHSWRTSIQPDWQSIEGNAKKLGENVILRHFFKCWLENHNVLIKQANVKIDTIRMRVSRYILVRWFHFSRSRGRRMRNTRKYWNKWLSHAHQQRRERELFLETARKLHSVKKAGLLIQWQNAQYTLKRYAEQRDKFLLMSCWKTTVRWAKLQKWKGYSFLNSRDNNSSETEGKRQSSSYATDEEKYDGLFTSYNFGERYDSMDIASADIEECTGILAEEDISLKKIKLTQTILQTQEKKHRVDIAMKNIIIQKRTLNLYQREIDKHCCICGGIHNSNDHIPHRKDSCRMLKKKQQVFKYLKQSLKESNMRMDNFKEALEKGVKEKMEAKLKMNHALISFIKSSSDIDRQVNNLYKM